MFLVMKTHSDSRGDFFRILCEKTYFFENLRVIEDALRNAKSRKLSQLPVLIAAAAVQQGDEKGSSGGRNALKLLMIWSFRRRPEPRLFPTN
jgi:hypothetical protein